MWQKGIKPPPLCFATQNIGEVSRSDGGVKPYNQIPMLSFPTFRRGDRNVCADERFIIKIHAYPTDFLLNLRNSRNF